MLTHETAQKLHLQLVHPLQEKLLKFLNNAGEPRKNTTKLKSTVKQVAQNCSIHIKKNSPGPVAGLSMPVNFRSPKSHI